MTKPVWPHVLAFSAWTLKMIAHIINDDDDFVINVFRRQGCPH